MERELLLRLVVAFESMAKSLERMSSEDGLLGAPYLTVNLEPSTDEALRVKLEPEE